MNWEQNRILIWKCKGMTNKAFQWVCKNYIRMTNPNIFIILETRVNPEI